MMSRQYSIEAERAGGVAVMSIARADETGEVAVIGGTGIS
jgi:hypothetical protein